MTRDQRQSATKQSVLDAALHLFARRGFGETSVQDIAKHANVDEASIARHFGDKKRLYAQVVQLAGDRFLRPMHRHLESHPATLAETLQQWVRALVQSGDAAALIRCCLAKGDPPTAAVVESLNRRLADFWQRRLDSVGDSLDAPRSRHHELAQLILAVASAFAVARKASALELAASSLIADFAATVERMVANSEAYSMYGVARAQDVICRVTPNRVPQAEDDKAVSLSPRELEVLVAVERGASNKGVARELGVTVEAVKFHLKRVYRKLSVHRRTEALKAARKRGLI